MACRLLPLLAAGVAALACTGVAAAQATATTPVQPRIFAPGTISGAVGADCLTFMPAGNTVFFDQQARSRRRPSVLHGR